MLLHAVNSNAASVTEVFQYVGRAKKAVGWFALDLDLERKEKCMVMVRPANGCPQRAFVTAMLPAWVCITVSAYIPLQWGG